MADKEERSKNFSVAIAHERKIIVSSPWLTSASRISFTIKGKEGVEGRC